MLVELNGAIYLVCLSIFMFTVIKAIIESRKNNKRPDEARIINFIDVFVESSEVSDCLFRERMTLI